ncbi:MAG: 50S ribosomal protein L4, partial [Rhodospirillales bacterium]|nr:50S ribosomal protein L4 [Rhodospirillales bacterium]
MTDKPEQSAETTTEPVPTIKLPIMRMDGSATGEEVELNPQVFGLPRNDHVIYLAVKAELHNKRQGTRSTLTRSMV